MINLSGYEVDVQTTVEHDEDSVYLTLTPEDGRDELTLHLSRDEAKALAESLVRHAESSEEEAG